MWRRRQSTSKITSITQQQQQLDIATIATQSMSTMSCQVVSWVFKATSPLWAIFIVTECNVKWSMHPYAHNNSKSHVGWKVMGSWIVTRAKHHPWLYIPLPLYEQEIFTLATSTKHWEFSDSSLRSEECLQCPTTGASDIWCTYVPWNFFLIQKPVKANKFSCMFYRCL